MILECIEANEQWLGASPAVQIGFLQCLGYKYRGHETPDAEEFSHSEVQDLLKVFKTIPSPQTRQNWLDEKASEYPSFRLPKHSQTLDQARKIIAASNLPLPYKVCLSILLIEEELGYQEIETHMIQKILNPLGVTASNLTRTVKQMLEPKEQWPLIEKIETHEDPSGKRTKLSFKLTKEGYTTIRNLLFNQE